MRIGLLTTSFPRHAGDYAGSFVGDRVAELLDEGHQVDVLAAGEPDGGGFTDRLTVTRLPAGAGLFYGHGAPEALESDARAWVAALGFFSALAGAARRRARDWDLIESHWLVPSALAASVAAPGIARRAWAHSGDVALLQRVPFGRTIARRLAQDGTDLRFVSPALQSRFATVAGREVGRVDSLRVSPVLFRRRDTPDLALRQRLGITGPMVLAVGRLVPIKGHLRLLRAAALAGAPRPEVVILGDGPERRRLANLAGELGVPLRLPGFVSRPEVADWMRAADLFALPSLRLANGRTEGAPTSLAEAHAVGVPTAATSNLAELARAIRAIG